MHELVEYVYVGGVSLIRMLKKAIGTSRKCSLEDVGTKPDISGDTSFFLWFSQLIPDV